MQSQRNKPLLDVEIRHMDKARFDGVRRVVQSLMGDVASPLETYSTPLSSANKAFKVVQANDTEFGLSATTANNFAVVGGDGSLNNPGILYFQGIYAFFKGHVLYKDQGDTGDLVDDDYTKTSIPSLTTPLAGNRVDIVYLDISFDEAGSLAGSTYEDSELYSPTIGTPTANRLRAVFDIRVYEGWSQLTDQTIFSNSFFGYFPGTVEHYKVPIAILNRPGNTSSILNSHIVDLLDREEKRVFTPKELTWNTRHGGATGLGEKWNDIGQNQGFSNRALNDDSVTPRILQDFGKFKMSALVVGATGQSNIITNNPTNLVNGEIVSDKMYLNNLYAGATGLLSSVRTIGHRIYADTLGLTTGLAGIDVLSRGVTGVNSYQATNSSLVPNWVVDHRGYMAIQKSVANYPLDVVGDASISHDVLVGNDLFVTRDISAGRNLLIGVNAFIGGSLTVTGSITSLNLIATNDLTVARDATINRDLIVNRNIVPNNYVIGDNYIFPISTLGGTNSATFGYTGIKSSAQATGTVSARIGYSAYGEGTTFGTFEGLDLSGNRGYFLGYGSISNKGVRVTLSGLAQTTTSTHGVVFDSGGPLNNYTVNNNIFGDQTGSSGYTLLINPGVSTVLSFTRFHLKENSARLAIYSGTSASGTLLYENSTGGGIFNGAAGDLNLLTPIKFTANSFFLVFWSNSDVDTREGFEARWAPNSNPNPSSATVDFNIIYNIADYFSSQGDWVFQDNVDIEGRLVVKKSIDASSIIATPSIVGGNRLGHFALRGTDGNLALSVGHDLESWGTVGISVFGERDTLQFMKTGLGEIPSNLVWSPSVDAFSLNVEIFGKLFVVGGSYFNTTLRVGEQINIGSRFLDPEAELPVINSAAANFGGDVNIGGFGGPASNLSVQGSVTPGILCLVNRVGPIDANTNPFSVSVSGKSKVYFNNASGPNTINLTSPIDGQVLWIRNNSGYSLTINNTIPSLVMSGSGVVASLIYDSTDGSWWSVGS